MIKQGTNISIRIDGIEMCHVFAAYDMSIDDLLVIAKAHLLTIK